MSRSLVLRVLLLASAARADGVLVELKQEIPDVVLDLRYATPDNFLHQQVYPDGARCLLHQDTVALLKKAADALRKQGFRLKLFDCYRPRAVQFQMWAILPKPGYVADPKKGSNHNRGTAVDLTLVKADGTDVEMPTEFDNFTKAAHHGYEGATLAAKQNRETLRAAMEGAGFKKNRMEWWHYDLPGATKYAIQDEPLVAKP